MVVIMCINNSMTIWTQCTIFKSLHCSFPGRITTRINIIDRIIGAVCIQVEPIAPVDILLGEAANDWIVEASTQIILLGDGVNLLAVVGEAVGDGLLLDLNLPPGIVGVAVLDVAIFIDDVGG